MTVVAPPDTRAPMFGVVPVLMMIVGVTLIGKALAAHGNHADISMLYLIPVIFAGTRYGLGTGLAAGLLAGLAMGMLAAFAYDLRFVAPLYSFAIADPSHAVSMAILIGTAIVSSHLGGEVRRLDDIDSDLTDRLAQRVAGLGVLHPDPQSR